MLIRGDARHIPLPDNSVQCVVTSPPYWGLRKYSGEQELVWSVRESKGIVRCNRGDHAWGEPGVRRNGRDWDPTIGESPVGRDYQGSTGSFCQLCGAWRGAFGLEPTIEMYVEHSVEILREIRRVLRPDGVCFWNIGDCYATGAGRVGDCPGGGKQGEKWTGYRGSNSTKGGKERWADGAMGVGPIQQPNRMPQAGLKPKDLCLIPARVALATQADGWWVRSDIIWAKPNPMPESVRDRPTDAYEHILMLTKSERYYWDAEAAKEPFVSTEKHRATATWVKGWASEEGPHTPIEHAQLAPSHKGSKFNSERKKVVAPNVGNGDRKDSAFGRNLRNVWTFATQPYKGAHFATFPVELVIRCLQAASKPGDLVMDPFGGSGTVGQVAFNMGRRFVLLDLAYQDLARKRIGGLALQM
jgi:DNA modification methylase